MKARWELSSDKDKFSRCMCVFTNTVYSTFQRIMRVRRLLWWYRCLHWLHFRLPLAYIAKVLTLSSIFTLVAMACWSSNDTMSLIMTDLPIRKVSCATIKPDIPKIQGFNTLAKHRISEPKTINRMVGTDHFMVSAYKDHRFKDKIRVIAIVRHLEIEDLFCHLCDKAFESCQATPATVEVNPEILGFAHAMADILCDSSSLGSSAAVRIANSTIIEDSAVYFPIKNLIKQPLRYNFTVCLSQIFNNNNNALQFVQTMEMYKIFGIQRVVIYNISSGAEVDKVMKHYVEEGTLEVIDWNIHDFMTPSEGWQPEVHPGDIMYHGQIVSLNDCLNRYMYHSKYILFHDFDEIVVPYKHNTLDKLMAREESMRKHDTIGLSRFERCLFQERLKVNGIFQKLFFEKWQRVPGLNILEHMSGRWEKNPKYMVDPRQIISVKVHDIVKSRWNKVVTINFETDVAHIHHIKRTFENMEGAAKETAIDTRLWDFNAMLIPNVNKVLEESDVL